MTLEEFEAKLKTHDWFYHLSDDMKAYDKGSKSEKELIKLANENGQEFIELYNKYLMERTIN